MDQFFGETYIIPYIALMLIFSLVWLVLSIILCVWVYRDAKRRFPPESSEPIVWLLIVLITGIIGLIIYLIVRPSTEKSEF